MILKNSCVGILTRPLTLLKRRHGTSFLVNFTKFLKTDFFHNTSWGLLLSYGLKNNLSDWWVNMSVIILEVFDHQCRFYRLTYKSFFYSRSHRSEVVAKDSDKIYLCNLPFIFAYSLKIELDLKQTYWRELDNLLKVWLLRW